MSFLRLISFYSIIFCVVLSAASIAFANAFTMHVMIDPGHGGNDGGAVHGQAKESDIALKIGLLLQELINKSPGFHASLTRQSDRYLSLQERVHLAEKNNADLLISLHANASTDRRAKGIEIYFQNHLPPDEETLFLASNENKFAQNTKRGLSENEASVENFDDAEPTKRNDVLSIIDDLKRQHRLATSHQLSQKLLEEWHQNQSHALRQAPFYVVSKANIPSVLVELGYLTHTQDALDLMSPRHQKEIAQKIYRGLLNFRHSKDKISEKMPDLGMIQKNQ